MPKQRADRGGATTMRLFGLTSHILGPAAVLLLLHLSRTIDSSRTDVNNQGGYVGSSTVGNNMSPHEIMAEHVDASSLADIGRHMTLYSLELILKDLSRLAQGDAKLTARYYSRAEIIMSQCSALKNIEEVVRQAYDFQAYEVIRCLAHYHIWADEAQRHWFWALLYGEAIIGEATWEEQKFEWDKFWKMVVKADNSKLFEMLQQVGILSSINQKEIHDCIIMFDAADILKSSPPELTRAIAMEVDAIMERVPHHIINHIVASVKDLSVSTNHVAPHTVTSSVALQYLLHFNYDQIPMSCLQSANHLTIHVGCAKWLVSHGCLSLLKEITIKTLASTYSQGELFRLAIRDNSLDVAEWLHENNQGQIPSENLVRIVVESGNLEAIKWIFKVFKDQIEWSVVLEEYYHDPRSKEITQYLMETVSVSSSPKVKLLLLAAEGKLSDLKDALKDSPGDFPWQDIANIACKNRHSDILSWIRDEKGILPENRFIEAACKKGLFGILTWVIKPENVRIASTNREGPFDALKCFLYAVMNKKAPYMDWIVKNLLHNEFPNLSASYDTYRNTVPDAAFLKAFEWIQSKTGGTTKVEPQAMLMAAISGHVQTFEWLCKQGPPITADIVDAAASENQIEILKAIYAINSSLVCTVRIANLLAGHPTVWTQNHLAWMRDTCKIRPTELGEDKDLQK